MATKINKLSNLSRFIFLCGWLNCTIMGIVENRLGKAAESLKDLNQKNADLTEVLEKIVEKVEDGDTIEDEIMEVYVEDAKQAIKKARGEAKNEATPNRE